MISSYRSRVVSRFASPYFSFSFFVSVFAHKSIVFRLSSLSLPSSSPRDEGFAVTFPLALLAVINLENRIAPPSHRPSNSREPFPRPRASAETDPPRSSLFIFARDFCLHVDPAFPPPRYPPRNSHFSEDSPRAPFALASTFHEVPLSLLLSPRRRAFLFTRRPRRRPVSLVLIRYSLPTRRSHPAKSQTRLGRANLHPLYSVIPSAVSLLALPACRRFCFLLLFANPSSLSAVIIRHVEGHGESSIYS